MTNIYSRIYGRANSFLGWTRFEKACFPFAWFLLGVARITILALPFRFLARHLGVQFGTEPWVPVLNSHDEARAASIGKVVRSAAAVTPWESTCLPQAVAARILLGMASVPYSLFLGVAGDGVARINAHAWVTSGRVRVTGGESFGSFTILGCFVAPQVAASRRYPTAA